MLQQLLALDHLLPQKVRGLNPMFGIAELLEKWELDATRMEDYADTRGAAVSRLHIAELREAVRAEENALLSYAEAERFCGYSERQLRHLRDTGELRDWGKKGAPLFRRSELPKKPKRGRTIGLTPDDAADDILAQLRSRTEAQ